MVCPECGHRYEERRCESCAQFFDSHVEMARIGLDRYSARLQRHTNAIVRDIERRSSASNALKKKEQNRTRWWRPDHTGRNELRLYVSGSASLYVMNQGVVSCEEFDQPRGLDITPEVEVEIPEVGWHSDPALRYRLRYFDGENWTPMVKNWFFRFNDPKWPF